MTYFEKYFAVRLENYSWKLWICGGGPATLPYGGDPSSWSGGSCIGGGGPGCGIIMTG